MSGVHKLSPSSPLIAGGSGTDMGKMGVIVDGVLLPLMQLNDLQRLHMRVGGKYILGGRKHAYAKVEVAEWTVPTGHFEVTKEIVEQFSHVHHLSSGRQIPTVDEITEATVIIKVFIRKRDRVREAVHHLTRSVKVLKRVLGVYVSKRRQMLKEAVDVWEQREDEERDALRATIAEKLLKRRPMRSFGLDSLMKRKSLFTADESAAYAKEKIPLADKELAVKNCYRRAFLRYHRAMRSWKQQYQATMDAVRSRTLHLFGDILCMYEVAKRADIPEQPAYTFKPSMEEFEKEHAQLLKKRQQAFEAETRRQVQKDVDRKLRTLSLSTKLTSPGGEDDGEDDLAEDQRAEKGPEKEAQEEPVMKGGDGVGGGAGNETGNQSPQRSRRKVQVTVVTGEDEEKEESASSAEKVSPELRERRRSTVLLPSNEWLRDCAVDDTPRLGRSIATKRKRRKTRESTTVMEDSSSNVPRSHSTASITSSTATATPSRSQSTAGPDWTQTGRDKEATGSLPAVLRSPTSEREQQGEGRPTLPSPAVGVMLTAVEGIEESGAQKRTVEPAVPCSLPSEQGAVVPNVERRLEMNLAAKGENIEEGHGLEGEGEEEKEEEVEEAPAYVPFQFEEESPAARHRYSHSTKRVDAKSVRKYLARLKEPPIVSPSALLLDLLRTSMAPHLLNDQRDVPYLSLTQTQLLPSLPMLPSSSAPMAAVGAGSLMMTPRPPSYDIRGHLAGAEGEETKKKGAMVGTSNRIADAEGTGTGAGTQQNISHRLNLPPPSLLQPVPPMLPAPPPSLPSSSAGPSNSRQPSTVRYPGADTGTGSTAALAANTTTEEKPLPLTSRTPRRGGRSGGGPAATTLRGDTPTSARRKNWIEVVHRRIDRMLM